MMKKCVLWGTGDFFVKYINVIRYHEACERLKIIAITSNSVPFDNYLGYRFVMPKDVPSQQYDYIILCADDVASRSIRSEAVSIGIPVEKILRLNAFLLPEFNFDKYISVIESRPTILADNCWGGITYNRLGMEFASPFINLWVKNDQYIKILENPKKYIESSISFKNMKYAPLVNKYYPLCMCEDVELRFNHYKYFEEAKDAWDRRRKRVNWDNLYYVMITEDHGIAERFCNLPHKNKICFVPFKTSEECLFYVDFYKRYNGPFWQAVVDMAKGRVFSYSVIDLFCGERRFISE